MTDSIENKFSLKKRNRKQLRLISILAKHENIEIGAPDSPNTSRFLLVSNCGLICEVSFEQLFDVFSNYGKIKDIVLIPQRPYALIEFDEELEAINAFDCLNQHFCQQLKRVLNMAFLSNQIWNQVLEKCEQTIQTYCSYFECKPNGLTLVEEFITSEEEEKILQFVSFDHF